VIVTSGRARPCGEDRLGQVPTLTYTDDGGHFYQAEQQKQLNKARVGGEMRPLYCDSRYYRIMAGGNGQGGVGCSN
jgi:hypothetical protein